MRLSLIKIDSELKTTGLQNDRALDNRGSHDLASADNRELALSLSKARPFPYESSEGTCDNGYTPQR